MYSLPYWRLSGFYFFHFAFIGAFAPYWGLYLDSLAFSAIQIGVLMSLLQVTRIFAPAAWGWLADHTGKRTLIVQYAAITGLISYCGIFFATSFIWVFIVMLLLSFFWSASLPLIEAITLSHLGENTNHYGRIRFWGSVGFVIAVVGVGYLLDVVEIFWLLWAILVLKLGIVMFAWRIPEKEVATHGVHTDSILQICKRSDVSAFLIASLLMLFAHGAYYTFYSIYLVENGYDKSMIGWLWATGVICEIGVFFLMPSLIKRYSVKCILIFSFACALIRFLMIGWGVESILMIIFAQILHAATYGTHHIAAMMVIHRFFQGRHQAKGQAIYTSIAFGVGGTLGGIFSGYAWEWLGPGMTFTISALASFVGLILIAWRMRSYTVSVMG